MIRFVSIFSLISLLSLVSLADVTVIPKSHWSKVEMTAEWAKECNLEKDPNKKLIVVLSSQDSAHTTGNECAQAVEKSYTDRTDLKFCEIGSHFVIASNGIVYEGRELGYKAACSYPNTGVIGITLAGCFDDSACEDPTVFTPNARQALVTFIAGLSKRYNFEITPQTVLPISARTSAAQFKHNPGNRVIGEWAAILEDAREARAAALNEEL